MSHTCSECGKHALSGPGLVCFWCKQGGHVAVAETPSPDPTEPDPRPDFELRSEDGPRKGRDLVLYDYQSEAVEALRANIRAGVMNQVLCAPTGSGKTIIATYLIREANRLGKRAVFAADRTALIDQTSAVLDDYGIDHGVMQGDHWRWRPWLPVQVVSPQTVERRAWPKDLDLIIVDECHTSREVNHKRIARRDCVTIGLTATPFASGMAKHYDAVVSVTTTNRLIADGQLAPFRVFAPSEPDMTGARMTAGEWTNKEAETRAIPIVGDCVREYLAHADGRKFLVFGATIAHCEELQRQFLAAGVHVALYTSRTPDGERVDTLREFRKPDSYIRGLSSVAALSKGFDVEDVSCIIMARPLRSSLAEHIQILGRGLRRDPGNSAKECIVLDHAGNMVRFWDDMNEFFEHGPVELDDGKPKKKARKDAEAEDRVRKCHECKHVHAPRPTCPNCGYEYPQRVVQHEAGELAEIGSPVEATMEEKQRWYSELIGECLRRGWKVGAAYHKYKERFGVGPASTLSKDPAPPSPEVSRWVQSRIIAYHNSKKKAAKKREASEKYADRWAQI